MREYFIDGIRYISKEQFCKLAHVRKANVLKLIQSGLIPYIDIGNQTHRYLIRQSDAEAYLTDRAHDPANIVFKGNLGFKRIQASLTGTLRMNCHNTHLCYGKMNRRCSQYSRCMICWVIRNM